MMGRDAVLATFARAAAGVDVAVIEGVMGLFDGASPGSDAGSTAEIARWLEAPVALVLDASGMARTAAAVAAGLASFDPRLRVAALVCNRVGGEGHLALLREAVAAPPVLGGLPDRPALAFPERHLGLVTAASALPDERIAAWARLAEEWLDLDAILSAARSATPLEDVVGDVAVPATAPVCRIGIARDEAFHFYYEDNLARLAALGATLVPFSPLHDRALPEVDGLYLGGGYPEEHAAGLAANAPMRDAVRAFVASGRPVYAECGGLMALASAIRTRDGRDHEGLGILPGVAVVHERLQAIGYAEVTTRAPSLLGPAGVRFRGHQFRYSELVGVPGPVARVYDVGGRGPPVVEGYQPVPNVLASYVHAHWASCPGAAGALVAACARAREAAP
jgi:cobyrinic acid a,c-diamide synthase